MTDAITVDVGDGAQMAVPTSRACWQQRYNPRAVNNLAIGSVLESYRYLILECTKEEAWRRIKLMRATVAQKDEQP